MCVMCAIQPSYLQVFVDMTFGAGGHTRRILQAAPKCIEFIVSIEIPLQLKSREKCLNISTFISHIFYKM